eukprot:7890-Prymnesium_polylepis.1
MVGDACRSESIAARNRIGRAGQSVGHRAARGCAGMMLDGGGSAVQNWEVCDAELYAILLYLRT